MPSHGFLPLVEPIARNAEFPSNLGGWTLPRIEELHGLPLKFRGESSSLAQSHLPRAIVPPFEVSVKPGLAQAPFLYCIGWRKPGS